jgi:Protein of unknown function (DUF3047)
VQRAIVSACVLAGALALAGCHHAPAPTSTSASSYRWTEGWAPFLLPGKTATAYAPGYVDGRWAIHAKSERSASMYRRAVRIEPGQLGNVTFSWKAASLLPDADVRESETGDAVVRVMLAFDGDPSRLSARTRMMFDLMQSLSGEPPPFATLMYVWDSRAEVDTVVLNRRSDRIRKIVLESGPTHLGQWRSYERDVRADYRRAFGEDPGALIGMAVMTDSDNTQSRAEAWYGEIRLH